jgi:hypothetical protein
MSDKSYVTLEQRVCVVCGCTYETGDLLLDQRLRERFEHHTVTGGGICPEHQAKLDEGYCILVGIDPARSTGGAMRDFFKHEEAYRTGEILYVRGAVWDDIFSTPRPPHGLAFVDEKVIEHLKNHVQLH